MPTVSEEEETSLFTIEKISPGVTPPISMLSGCALCQHCSLLRLLAQSNYENPHSDGGCHKPGLAQKTSFLSEELIN